MSGAMSDEELSLPPPIIARAGSSAATAGQWRLMAWRFSRHKLAVVSLVVVVLLYLTGIFAEFLAPYSPETTRQQYTYAPPQGINLFAPTPDGGWTFNLHASGYDITVDTEAMRRTFTANPDKLLPLGLFVTGQPYKLFGLIDADIHLIGATDPKEVVYLLGSDRLGRDVLSRLIHGTRISMSIGLVGVVISLVLLLMSAALIAIIVLPSFRKTREDAFQE